MSRSAGFVWPGPVAGSYVVSKPTPVGPVGEIFFELRRHRPDGPVLAGFDFPMGLPRDYALRANIPDFPLMLQEFGRGGVGGILQTGGESA